MWIEVVRGAPTDEEVAALVAVLTATSTAAASNATAAPTATAAAGSDARPSRWAASARPGYAHADGRPARPGPHAWRASSLPSPAVAC